MDDATAARLAALGQLQKNLQNAARLAGHMVADEIRACYEAGVSRDDIAKVLGVTPGRVSQKARTPRA